ncbi:MAG TPA: radical SAM protein [Verrucomicrobia bacterium]|nr:radical SAM protein [Verrucomicrobiota bacterium]
MYLRMAKRVLLETDKRLLWKFAYNFGWRGMRSVQRFKKGLKKGEYFPPFLYISVLNSCNLRCQGCWVDVAAKQEKIEAEQLHRLIDEASEAGNSFFGILGGEPFMYKGLLDILREHQDCYFQIFTNGQFITDEVAKKMRAMGNVTPLISIEGTELVSDERRGKADVYSKSMQGVLNCVENKLLTGVATSLCQNNLDDLLREEWLDKLIDLGVMYAWYHTYRPVGPEPNEQLCLTPEQQIKVRKFVVNMRCEKPLALIDAYYMDDGQALCPAATGISHHISPWGAIEPCPIIQFAKENINDDRHIRDVFVQSEYLSDFRKMSSETTRGCIMLERPDKVKEFVEKHNAPDGTARKTALPELEAMKNRPSQWNRTEQIPEKNWIYKFAKKHFFNDFGAYKNLKDD